MTAASALEKPAPVLRYAGLILVLITSVMVDARVLFASPLAVGLDGYYYVLQVDGLTNGQLFFKTNTPLVLYFLTGIHFLIGETPVAIKVGAIVLHALLCAGIAALLIKSTASWWLGVLGSGYAAIAGLHYYMVSEFISNLGAVTFIIIAMPCLILATENHKWFWRALALVSFLAALASHRSSIFLLVSLGVVACWAYFYHLAALTRNTRLLLVLLLIAVILYFSPYILGIQPFFNLPPPVMAELSARPIWPFTKLTLFDSLILCLAAPVVLILRFRQSPAQRLVPHSLFSALALLTILFSLNAFIKPDEDLVEIAGRLQTLIYIEVALLVPYAIWMVGNLRPLYKWYASAVAVPLLLLSTQMELPLGLGTRYLADRERLMNAAPVIKAVLPPDSLIIAPHGEEFVITASTGIRTRSAWSGESQYESIYWMLRSVPTSVDLPRIKELFSAPNGTARVLVSDADLWTWWTRAQTDQRQKVMSGNPHLRNFLKVKERNVESDPKPSP